MILVCVEASHFCAGIIFDKTQIVVRAAPILTWTLGKQAAFLATYFHRKGWKVKVLE
jgi:hypothetical protein